jgi:predicted exporter
MNGRRMQAWRKLALYAAAALALALVFAAYLNPHIVRDLATRVWACF